jgi:hypothetical protein
VSDSFAVLQEYETEHGMDLTGNCMLDFVSAHTDPSLACTGRACRQADSGADLRCAERRHCQPCRGKMLGRSDVHLEEVSEVQV